MYKTSKYNSIIPLQDKMYYINALKGAVFPVKREEHRTLKALFSDPITFELEYPSVFNQFFQWGFFTDSDEKEEMLFYYRYLDEVVNNSGLHLSLLLEKNDPIDTTFMECLKTYISAQLASRSISSLTLEWNGNHLLSCFDTHIYPFSKTVEAMCKEKKLDFYNQLNIAVSCNPRIHNKLFHDKGVPTYDKHHSTIRSLCENSGSFDINLRIVRTADEEQYNSFTASLVNNERVRYLPVAHTDRNPKMGKIFYIRKESIHCARKNLILINSNAEVFSSYVNYINNAQTGNLDANGNIKWKTLQREKELAIPWFNNRICKKCPYLPLLVQVCCNYQIKNDMLICPLKNHIITVENILTLITGKTK